MLDDTNIASTPGQIQAMVQARQEIEYLRRAYAIATDQLGMSEEVDAQANGLSIYRRIFTPDATVKVTRDGETLLSASGPDGWADVARNALHDYASTQHLIGTQFVSFEELDTDADTQSVSVGVAHMSSYLQATHVWPDRRMRLVLGTYLDRARWVKGIGWQIEDMTLVYTSESFHQLDNQG